MYIALGLTPRNLNSFEFKFDDMYQTFLIIQEWDWLIWIFFVVSWLAKSLLYCQQGRDLATSGHNKNFNWAIFFTILWGRLVLSNLNSKLFRFNCVHLNVHTLLFRFPAIFGQKRPNQISCISIHKLCQYTKLLSCLINQSR